MSVDPTQLRFTAYSTYYGSFFVLRMAVTINGQQAVIEYSLSGELTLNSRNPKHGIPFSSIFADLEAVLKKNGVTGVGNFFCEDVPLYEVVFSSNHTLRNFLRSKPKVQSELASLFSSKFQPSLPPTSPSQPIPAFVETNLFLISPDMVKKDARIVHVTPENCSTCMSLWKESELFDFDSLFRVYRLDPSKLPGQGKRISSCCMFSCYTVIAIRCI